MTKQVTEVSAQDIEHFGLFDDGAMDFEAAKAAVPVPDTSPITDEGESDA